MKRQPRPARAVETGVEALGGVDDPAVGVPQGDGDRVAAAHQDALDQSLAAVVSNEALREVYRVDSIAPRLVSRKRCPPAPLLMVHQGAAR